MLDARLSIHWPCPSLKSTHPCPGPRPRKHAVFRLCMMRRCAAFVPPPGPCSQGGCPMPHSPSSVLLCSSPMHGLALHFSSTTPTQSSHPTRTVLPSSRRGYRVSLCGCAHLFPRAGPGAQDARRGVLALCSGSTKNTRPRRGSQTIRVLHDHVSHARHSLSSHHSTTSPTLCQHG